MKFRSYLSIILFFTITQLCLLVPNCSASEMLFCTVFKTKVINFPAHPKGRLPFPDYTNITDEFWRAGIIFSTDDSDLPADLVSNGNQDNLIISALFTNPFRINFVVPRPVISASVKLIDCGGLDQHHYLTAFDSAGNVVDRDTHFDYPQSSCEESFVLNVSSCNGIDFIVYSRNPLGASTLLSISYSTRKGKKRVLPPEEP